MTFVCLISKLLMGNIVGYDVIHGIDDLTSVFACSRGKIFVNLNHFVLILDVLAFCGLLLAFLLMFTVDS